MIIWLIDALSGGVSPVGEASFSVGVLFGGTFALLGILQISLALGDELSLSQKSNLHFGFSLLALAAMFFLGGSVVFALAIISIALATLINLWKAWKVAFLE